MKFNWLSSLNLTQNCKSFFWLSVQMVETAGWETSGRWNGEYYHPVAGAYITRHPFRSRQGLALTSDAWNHGRVEQAGFTSVSTTARVVGGVKRRTYRINTGVTCVLWRFECRENYERAANPRGIQPLISTTRSWPMFNAILDSVGPPFLFLSSS